MKEDVTLLVLQIQTDTTLNTQLLYSTGGTENFKCPYYSPEMSVSTCNTGVIASLTFE